MKIIDTTLRDGSYAVNFSFSANDTACICKELESAGVEYIEIGHGVGLGGSKKGYGEALATDKEYLVAARDVLKNAMFGMFCIPEIAELEDLEMAAEYGMGFVRVGCNVNEVRKTERFIKKAKKLGLFVAANYMKSYAATPKDFAEQVMISESYGADMIYIVDSAGGMFREDIEKYFAAIRKNTDIQLGFHAHDNLGLAVSNTLEAIKMGIEYIDVTLQGLGRSAGNAAAELVVLALLKQGYTTKINYHKILEAGQCYIQPLIKKRGKSVLDMVSGYADFHSSYMKYIQKYSDLYNVNPIELIIEYCKYDKVNLNEALLGDIAKKIRNIDHIYLNKYGFNEYIGDEQK